MKTNIRLIIVIAILLISIFALIKPIFAVEIGDIVNITGTKKVKSYMKFGNLAFLCSVAETTNVKEKAFAYCMEITKDGIEWVDNYDLKITKKYKGTEVYSVIKQGYPVKTVEELGATNEGMAFMATKQAIYSALYNREVSQYIPRDTEEGKKAYRIFSEILTKARNNPTEYIEPKIEALVSQDWHIIDEGFIERNIKLDSNIKSGEYIIEIVDNKIGAELIKLNEETASEKKDKMKVDINDEIRIRVANKDIDNYFREIDKSADDSIANNDLNIKIKIKAKVKSHPVYYGESLEEKNQDCVFVGTEFEELELEKNLKIERFNSILEIKKIDEETKKPIEGVIFEVYKEDKRVFDNLITDENGMIIIESLLPGEYIVKEVKTKEGYVLSNKENKVNLDLNERFLITIKNKKEEIPPKEEKPKKKAEKKIKKLPYTGLY